MQVMAYAGIPISKTYEIIKNIAKKRVEKVKKYKDQFITGMKKKLIEDEKIDAKEGKRIADMTWQIISDSSAYSFNSSHSYSVAGDSLYGAYLKSHYPMQFYETFLNILEEDSDKDRLAEVKIEAEHAYKIKFPQYKFRQDNRKIKADYEKKEITSSLSSLKGFSSSIGENLYELGQNKYDNFMDFLIDAEEKNYLSNKIETLIKINYFDEFGNNKKLLEFYREFTKGDNRYSQKHTEKTKEKRIAALREIFENLANDRLPFIQQILEEQEILGKIWSTFPKLDKRFVYVSSLDEKFAPRIEVYCMNNGATQSLKIQKKVFENNNFLPQDVLYCEVFEKKKATKFIDGKFVESENEYLWWLNKYKVYSDKEFDTILSKI
jgi:DNA polymerase III alpha subunit